MNNVNTIFPELPKNDPTTWMQDFAIANMFGAKAIESTYKTAIKEWKNDFVMLTWLVVALNHWSWLAYEQGEKAMCELYTELYYKASDLFYKTYEKNKTACQYYFEITD